MDLPLLSSLICVPLIGAAFLFTMRGDKETVDRNARQVALWTALFNLALAVVAWMSFDPSLGHMQMLESHPWIESFNINYNLGVDGISLPFVLLTALLTPICILVSWTSITKQVRAYMAAFLALEAFVIGVFCALDFVLFYVFWEAMLIPMFIIIGVWGGENRVYAAIKFFLYTFVGSVLMLIAMLYMYQASGGSFDIQHLATLNFAPEVQKWLWLALFAAFAVKVPMWPVHTWLPDAHVQAPTAGSVILAGILLKMGAYGFLRFSLPMLPEASAYFAPMVFALSVIAIIYTALVALMQTDIKKLIAYSSVSHMGFVTLGIFAGTVESIQGSIMQMVNHGVVAAALFMLVGVVYDRMHTRDIAKFGGIVNTMPVYALVFMLFTMASVGLPGTNNFVGEFLILLGSYKVAQMPTALACAGIVLGACYMLWLYKRMVFGEIKNAEVKVLTDMNLREKISFAPLIILALLLGLVPALMLDMSAKSVQAMVDNQKLKYQLEPAELALATQLKGVTK
ncbi:MAG: NADH-quinone oxidoreductase subunit M [Proteobacteria bacterium]|nr:NADH-quinone oxidoreductase subunit M [Pseudomonadota bacterium]